MYCKNIVQESAITLTTISSKFDCCFLINHSLKNMDACNNVWLRQPYSYFIRHLLLICGLYVCPKLIAYLWGTYSSFKGRNEHNVSYPSNLRFEMGNLLTDNQKLWHQLFSLFSKQILWRRTGKLHPTIRNIRVQEKLIIKTLKLL